LKDPGSNGNTKLFLTPDFDLVSKVCNIIIIRLDLKVKKNGKSKKSVPQNLKYSSGAFHSVSFLYPIRVEIEQGTDDLANH